MLIRIYALAWAALIALAGILVATGTLNEITLTILGFLVPTLFFAGILGVLPWQMEKHYSRHTRTRA